MEAAAEITALEEHSGRTAGTDAERRAAVHLRGRLAEIGGEAELQPIEVRPRFGLAHALHALAAIAGGVLATAEPLLGTAAVAAAALSAALDTAGAVHVARRLTGRRASQNVEWREDHARPGVVILAAGYDSPRGGSLQLLHDPWAVLLAAILAILAVCVLRLAGLDGTGVAVAQFVPTVLLILLIPPLLGAELDRPESDPAGAAGVAVALRLAEELGGRLRHLELWVVLTGSSHPGGLGMRRWLRRRRAELAGRRAAVVSIGPVGEGGLRHSRREGPVVPLRCDPELLRICSEIADDDREGAYAAAPTVRRGPGDAYAAMSRGVPAISVWSEGDEAGDVDRAAGFCRELVERLDSDAGLRRA